MTTITTYSSILTDTVGTSATDAVDLFALIGCTNHNARISMRLESDAEAFAVFGGADVEEPSDEDGVPGVSGESFRISDEPAVFDVRWSTRFVRFIATDADTDVEVFARHSAQSTDTAPAITTAPTLAGTIGQGNTLTLTPGTVTGTPTPVTTVSWHREPGGQVPGADGLTYLQTWRDGGRRIFGGQHADSGVTPGASRYTALTDVVPVIDPNAEVIVDFPDTLLRYVPEDFDDEAGTWANSGTLGAIADLTLVGTSATKGADDFGAYVSINGGRFESPLFATGYAGTDWTASILHDGSSTVGFAWDFQKSGARVSGRYTAATPKMDLLTNAYHAYTADALGRPQYQVFTLDGSEGEGVGRTFNGGEDPLGAVTYPPMTVDTSVRMIIGSLFGGSNPFVGKIRAITIAAEVLDESTMTQLSDAHASRWAGWPRGDQDAYLVLGQSNAAGNQAFADFSSIGGVDYTAPYAETRYMAQPKAGWGFLDDSGASTGTGPEVSLGRGLPDDSTIIKYGIAGTNLAENWDPATGTTYAAAVAYIDARLAQDPLIKIAGIYWDQGESDLTAPWSAAYEANLQDLYDALKLRYTSRLASGFRFAVRRLSTAQNNSATGNAIRAGQDALASNNDDVFTINSDALTLTDGVHFDAAGLVSNGTAAGVGFLASPITNQTAVA